MQATTLSRSSVRSAQRVMHTPAGLGLRRPMQLCRTAETDAGSTSESKPIDWTLPEQAGPVVDFLAAEDFKLQEVEVYSKYVKPVVENEMFSQSLGWKQLPETINGRAAMLGFVAAAGAEIFGSGSILAQLSKAPQPVLLIVGIIVASSIIPIYKGAKGDYLSSLMDTYSLPEGLFTAKNEKIIGRLAMLGLGGLLALEVVLGRAIL